MPIAKFKVRASGYPTPITYQWQISDGSGGFTDLSNGSGYSGVDRATLIVQVSDVDQNGEQFRAIVSNPAKTVISRAATLTVTG